MSEPEPPAEPAASPGPPREEPMLYCPVCSSRLTSRKCKLICEKCGYYMSCADYY
jgi:methionyl-tRNA synthetase